MKYPKKTRFSCARCIDGFSVTWVSMNSFKCVYVVLIRHSAGETSKVVQHFVFICHFDIWTLAPINSIYIDKMKIMFARQHYAVGRWRPLYRIASLGNYFCFVVGPAQFLSCPMDMKRSQSWFTDLWNNSIIPYLVQVIKDSSARVCVFASELTVEIIRYFLIYCKNEQSCKMDILPQNFDLRVMLTLERKLWLFCRGFTMQMWVTLNISV